MANGSGHECYLCGDAIEREQATVTIPRLALCLHLSCYERDMGTRSNDPRRATLGQALSARAV